MAGQAGPGTLASGDGNDSTDCQIVLGVANVHVDAVVLYKDTYMQQEPTSFGSQFSRVRRRHNNSQRSEIALLLIVSPQHLALNAGSDRAPKSHDVHSRSDILRNTSDGP